MIRAFMLFIAMSLAACDYNHVKQADAPNTDAVSEEAVATPDFQTIKSLVIGNCTGCHSDAGGNRGGVNLESYQAVVKLRGRIAERCLKTKDMPPSGPLDAQASTALANWIDNGCPENNSVIGSKPDAGLKEGPDNWGKVSGKIFARKCNDCHSQPSPKANLDLTDINVVKAKQRDIFGAACLDLTMPIAGYPATTKADCDVLYNWISAGNPQ